MNVREQRIWKSLCWEEFGKNFNQDFYLYITKNLIEKETLNTTRKLKYLTVPSNSLFLYIL